MNASGHNRIAPMASSTTSSGITSLVGERGSPSMAKDTTTAEPPEVEWEHIPTGLGQEWDFQRGPLVGNYLGERRVETTKVDTGEAFALEFALASDPNTVVMLWKSSELATAFDPDPASGLALIHVGDLCRINDLGRDQFTGADGKPRQIKRYKVEAAKR